ncbi:monocarboxylate transporter 13-like [Amphiura filiformis]|uniref:monocarboxylate transporter 13-like n=1 Tax=Amphiura filiformis TaxID=82378 RepID=UPI003B210A63
MARTTWDAYMVVVGGFVFYMFQLGTHKALGVFVPYFISGLDMTAYQVGISCGIGAGVKFLLGPIWAAVTTLADSRILTFSGGVLTGLGFLWVGFSTTSVDLSLALLITGIGLGLPLVAVQNIVRDYFADKNYNLAVGLIFVGSAVGMTLFPPVTEFFIDMYGWRSASILMGASCFNISVGAALFKPLPESEATHLSRVRAAILKHLIGVRATLLKPSTGDRAALLKPLPCLPDEAPTKTSHDSCVLGKCKLEKCKLEKCKLGKCKLDKLNNTLAERCRNFFGFSIIVEEPIICIYFVAFILWGIAYTGWMLFLFSYAISLGYTPRFASLLSAIGGLGTLTGRVMTTFLCDTANVSAQMQFAVLSAVSCLALMLHPIASVTWALIAVSFFAGIGIGTPPAAMVLITKDISSTESYSSALGLLFMFQGMGLFAGGPVTGLIYDITHGFNAAFISLAIAELTAAILALIKTPEVVKLLQ